MRPWMSNHSLKTADSKFLFTINQRITAIRGTGADPEIYVTLLTFIWVGFYPRGSAPRPTSLKSICLAMRENLRH